MKHGFLQPKVLQTGRKKVDNQEVTTSRKHAKTSRAIRVVLGCTGDVRCRHEMCAWCEGRNICLKGNDWKACKQRLPETLSVDTLRWLLGGKWIACGNVQSAVVPIPNQELRDRMLVFKKIVQVHRYSTVSGS